MEKVGRFYPARDGFGLCPGTAGGLPNPQAVEAGYSASRNDRPFAAFFPSGHPLHGRLAEAKLDGGPTRHGGSPAALSFFKLLEGTKGSNGKGLKRGIAMKRAHSIFLGILFFWVPLAFF